MAASRPAAADPKLWREPRPHSCRRSLRPAGAGARAAQPHTSAGLWQSLHAGSPGGSTSPWNCASMVGGRWQRMRVANGPGGTARPLLMATAACCPVAVDRSLTLPLLLVTGHSCCTVLCALIAARLLARSGSRFSPPVQLSAPPPSACQLLVGQHSSCTPRRDSRPGLLLTAPPVAAASRRPPPTRQSTECRVPVGAPPPRRRQP